MMMMMIIYTDIKLYYQYRLRLLSPVKGMRQKKMKNKYEPNISDFILLNKPNLGKSRIQGQADLSENTKKWYRRDSNPVPWRGCLQCCQSSMTALGSYHLKLTFNTLSHAANNMTGGMIIKSGTSLAWTHNRFYLFQTTLFHPATITSLHNN